MKHDDIRHKLSEYIDGAVSDEEKTEIEEHLKACTKCSDALAELRKTIEQVKQVSEVEPPVWMTQKIMAKVREESERRAGIWNKLLSSLHMRPAISAVAVLFLAVTAFYIYQNIRPEMKFAEAPVDTFAKKEAPSAGMAQDKVGKADESQLPAKQAPQAPEYKSLDMKYAYEKPASPVPKEQATEPAPAAVAPAPAKPAEQPTSRKETAGMKSFEADKVPAGESERNILRDQKTTLSKKREQGAPSAGFLAMDEARQSATMPNFEDYQVTAIYKGEPAPVDLTSHPRAEQFRTMIREGAQKGPDFAGHYTIVKWGCGTSCVALAVIDAVTGKVYFPPILSHVSWAGWREQEYGLRFRVDSNLLKVYGSPNEQDEKGIFYYIWKDNELELIKSDIKK